MGSRQARAPYYLIGPDSKGAPVESRSIRRPALCPACGAPGFYNYELKGPVDRDGNRLLEISYSFKCEVCGYEDSGGLYIPLDAIYRIRHLLVPEALALVERVKVITDIAPLGVKAGAEASATTGEGH